MKKVKPIISMLLIACVLSSCATVFGGRVNAYQRTKPAAGEQTRPLRVGAFISDFLLFAGFSGRFCYLYHLQAASC